MFATIGAVDCVRTVRNVVRIAMPKEPPSWRARLIRPEACCASLGLRLAYATLLIGVKRKPSAAPRMNQRVPRVGLAGVRGQMAQRPHRHDEQRHADEDQHPGVDERPWRR